MNEYTRKRGLIESALVLAVGFVLLVALTVPSYGAAVDVDVRQGDTSATAMQQQLGVRTIEVDFAVNPVGTDTSTNTVTLMTIPKGTFIQDITLYVDEPTSHASGTVLANLGDADDPDCFMDLADLSAASGTFYHTRSQVVADGPSAAGGTGKYYSAAKTLKLQTSRIISATLGGKIRVKVLYHQLEPR